MDGALWLSKREEGDWRALQFMHVRLTARLSRELATSRLSYQDYLVLVALTDRTDGRMRLFELGRELGWEKSRLSHHIARMAGRGLVAKQRCNSDGRGAVVSVTRRGREELRVAAPGHVAAVRRLFIDRLTPRQLETIGAASRTVLAALDGEEAVGEQNDERHDLKRAPRS